MNSVSMVTGVVKDVVIVAVWKAQTGDGTAQQPELFSNSYWEVHVNIHMYVVICGSTFMYMYIPAEWVEPP